jgi:hypothetical protein
MSSSRFEAVGSKLPPLPAGYSAQEVWGFHDARGLSYTFCNVYGPPEGHDQRGSFSRLDEGRSYWVAIWRTHDDAGDHTASRWITYAEARGRSQRRLKFRAFSSVGMHDEVTRLLHVEDIGL